MRYRPKAGAQGSIPLCAAGFCRNKFTVGVLELSRRQAEQAENLKSLAKRGSACARSKGGFAGLDENQGVLVERRIFAGLAEDLKSRAEVGCAPRADALRARPKTEGPYAAVENEAH